MQYDFIGTAAAYDVTCEDGVIIEPGTFAHQSNTIVPLGWEHDQSIHSVLGHGLLVDDPKRIAVHGTFNPTDAGESAKYAVINHAIKYLSIYAVKVKRRPDDPNRVYEAVIREVSLVYAGKNPGARIEHVIVHSDDPFAPPTILADEMIIHSGTPVVVSRTDGDDGDSGGTIRTLSDIISTFTYEEHCLMHFLIATALNKKPMPHDPIRPYQLIYDGLTQDKKLALEYGIQQLIPTNPE